MSETFESLSPEERARTIHELRVHQIELEMQNEELRQTQIALDTQRARYVDLYDLAPAGYLTLNEKGIITEANLTAAGMLGLAKSALRSQPLTRFIHRDDQDAFYLQHKKLLTTGEPQACDLRMTARDGKGYWAHLTATCHRDESGVTVCRIALTDSTGRKKAEEELCDLNATLERQVEERTVELSDARNAAVKLGDTLNEAQKIAHLGSFEYIAATRQTVWSEEEYRIYGLDPAGPSPEYEEMLAQCIHPDDAELLHLTFTAALVSGSVYEHEHRIVRPDGSVRWVYDRAHPYFDEQGNLVRCIGTTLDITDRRQAEEEIRELNRTLEQRVAERNAELRASEEKFRDLVETASDCIWELDLQGNFTYLSPRFRHIYGYPVEDYLGKPPLNLVTGADAGRARADFQAIFAEKRPFNGMEHDIVHEDGRVMTVEVSGVPFFDAEGIMQGYRGITRDVTERKQLFKAITDSEERFRRLFEQHSATMLLIDPENGAIIDANDAAAEFYGYPQKTLQTMNIAEINLLPPEEIARRYRQAQTLNTNIFNFPHRLADGSIRTVEVHSSPVISGGKMLLFSIIHDITEKQRLEDALLLTQASIDAVSDEIHWLSKDARILDVNPAMCRALGYTRDELLRMSILEIDPQLDREKFERLGPEVRKAGSVMFETEHRTKGGRLIPVEVCINSVRQGTEERICAISRDISERRRLESVLRSSEERHRLLFEHAADAILIMNLEGKFISVNEQACRQYGYDREKFLTLNVADLDTPEQRAYISERMAALETSGRAAFETVYRDAEGRDIPVEVKSVRIVIDGAPSYMSICRDITERKKYERELEAARQAADAASHAKSEFLSNMSHEIRTPMNGIIGMAQLMEYTDLTDQQLQYLEAIKSSSNNLLRLINDILDLSKIEAGKIELEQHDFSLRATVEDVVNTQISLLYRKNLKLTTDVSADVPDGLIGDQLRLKQIILNFLSNAIKFTAAGGITVSAALVEQTGTAAVIRIGVTDSGIGISPEAVRKIFEPFSQADSSTTRQYGGTGLGLSICRQLAELMGGRIGVESTEGVGSTFYVVIPCLVKSIQPEPHDRRKSDTAVPGWAGGPLRVLVADDEELNLRITTGILQKSGSTVCIARNGQEAVAAWKKERFDLVLMDIKMPVLDGIGAAAEIRREEGETGRHTTVIALTANALREEKERILQRGFDGYVTKPVEFKLLFDEIRRCCAGTAADPDRSSVVPSEPPPAAEALIDREKVSVLAGEIETLLGQGNLASRAKVDELTSLLAPSPEVENLRQCVKRYDFTGALRSLVEICREHAV